MKGEAVKGRQLAKGVKERQREVSSNKEKQHKEGSKGWTTKERQGRESRGGKSTEEKAGKERQQQLRYTYKRVPVLCVAFLKEIKKKGSIFTDGTMKRPRKKPS